MYYIIYIQQWTRCQIILVPVTRLENRAEVIYRKDDVVESPQKREQYHLLIGNDSDQETDI